MLCETGGSGYDDAENTPQVKPDDSPKKLAHRASEAPPWVEKTVKEISQVTGLSIKKLQALRKKELRCYHFLKLSEPLSGKDW
ncbi:hypothetical protein QUF80_09470 [Desulfococcaceae bacterium HSG8]|nr:hypothetical protein [Desulfococcaceae bacterium HSG8]